jgi:formylglycine-generating enzyme required for sulfatase activity
MILIPAGTFTMGTNDPRAWPDEKPPHRVALRAFFIDTTEVTNAQFEAFVKATAYVTTAEKKPDLQALMAQQPPGTPPPPAELLVPGALVFDGQWKWTPGASWKHPEGPRSDLKDRGSHPVVQVSWDDAAAYAKWAGKRLPTEAEWEYAARGGLENAFFTWGDRPATPKDANFWQGHFPDKNTLDDGYAATAPVGSFAPNGYGLRDMAGNVWEWTADWYDRSWYAQQEKLGVTNNPRGPDKSFDPTQPFTPLRVTRGGSFLCSDTFCFRYRPSARQGCSPDTAMNHTGFRCVKDAPPGASERPAP